MSKTVFDLFGKFTKRTREKTGGTVLQTRHWLKLQEDMEVNYVSQLGATGLENLADRLAVPHSHELPFERQFLIDFEIRPRVVAESSIINLKRAA